MQEASKTTFDDVLGEACSEVEGGTSRNVDGPDVHSPENRPDGPPGDVDGQSPRGNAEDSANSSINAAIEALGQSIAKTARLSRRTARDLHAASSAPYAAADAYASALILDPHAIFNLPSTNGHTQRAMKHDAPVRNQAGAIVPAVRAVSKLNESTANSREEVAHGEWLHAALGADIQADDGGLRLELRTEAEDRRK